MNDYTKTMNDYVKPIVEKRMQYLEREINDQQAYQQYLNVRLEDSKTEAKSMEKEYRDLKEMVDTPRSKVLQK